tara:strand:+ start:131 stop:1378 length:1248 start_codon:yes stop_codon:yes gene_type:complete
MSESHLTLGIDLGTSGVRIAIIDSKFNQIYFEKLDYPHGIEYPDDWNKCCIDLIQNIPKNIKDHIKLICTDGTSGTLVACNLNGKPVGNAIAYNRFFPEYKKYIFNFLESQNPAREINSSFARAVFLNKKYGSNIIMRHQADWISGWLIKDWRWGEEGNNYRLGWNSMKSSWPKSYKKLIWIKCLPEIVKSGTNLGAISPEIAKKLDLPKDTLIIAGTTDSNAAVLAANPSVGEGITVLGSTIVVKSFVDQPIKGIGITNHRIGNQWICGGASNAGCSILKKFFSNKEITELSKQINPNISSGLNFMPLISKGERFPVNDPNLEPILTPRPISDALYLHGLLESLAKIEYQSWKKLIEYGADTPKRIITLGGGSINPQWKRIRERIIGIEILSYKTQPAFGIARFAMEKIDQYLN